LLRVLEPIQQINGSQPVDPFAWQIRKREAELYLQEISPLIAARIDDSKPGKDDDITRVNRVEYAILSGKPSEAIVSFAHKENIDLMVISTHGWGGFSRWNISSVAQKVLEKIYLPVLLIRAYEEEEGHKGDDIRYNRILLPLDSSARAEYVLSAAVSLARGEKDREAAEASKQAETDPKKEEIKTVLLLTTVIRPPEMPIPEPYSQEVEALMNKLIQLSQKSVQEYLIRIKTQLSVPSEIRMIEHHSVSEALHKLAKEEDIDLIIIAAHGYTGQYHYPYGSVTRNMLDFGAKPILIIQDVPLSQVQPSNSEIAAQRSEGTPDVR
jgi:nucleotide-binding universal stress UspA family protein